MNFLRHCCGRGGESDEQQALLESVHYDGGQDSAQASIETITMNTKTHDSESAAANIVTNRLPATVMISTEMSGERYETTKM